MTDATTEPQPSLPDPEHRPRHHREPARTPYLRARRFIYDLLHSPTIDTRLEHFVRLVILWLILLSVAAVVLESVEEINARIHPYLMILEYFSVAVFTVEYLLRLWSVVENVKFSHPFWGRIRYIFSFFGLIDLVAVLPFYLHHVIPTSLLMLRALRLVRLLRVLKLGRYSVSIGILSRVFRKKREELATSLLVISLILLISSALMFYLEHEAQPKAFPNIPASLWWGVATLTTVGYGDIYPITALGKLCAAVIAILGIGLVALPSGILVSGFIEEMPHRHQPAAEPHPEPAHKYCPHCGEKL